MSFSSVRTLPGLLCSVGLLVCVFSSTAAHEVVPAPPPGPVQYTDDTCLDPSQCGRVGPLIPMHITNVHSGIVWRRGQPQLLSFFRFPNFCADDVVDPSQLHSIIDGGALSSPGKEFNAAIRESFQQLVYGGYQIIQGLSQSVPTRIFADQWIELTQLLDLSDPDAFSNNGKFDNALLDDADFALNSVAFEGAGRSKGLMYNIYCAGHATIEDGRVVFVGGHDMNSSNGLYKINVYDPDAMQWEPRTPPCTVTQWLGRDNVDDPYHEAQYADDPEAYFEDCDPHTRGPEHGEWPFGPTPTQPSDASDMKYARWYPTAITLPNNMVLILGGNDRDETIDPQPGANPQDAQFRGSTIGQVVPELFDPATGRTIALECARKGLSLYPHCFVVSTGPGVDDWNVAVTGRGNTGETWSLDVQAALADPDRDESAERHWALIAEAENSHNPYFATSEFVRLAEDGHVASHRVVAFGGLRPGTGTVTALVEMIEFVATGPGPEWQRQDDLLQPARYDHAVPLPDGTAFVSNGADFSESGYEDRFNLRFQLFDPADGSIRLLAKTTVPRTLHATVTLLPTAEVLVAGHDRIDLVQRGDRIAPLGDPDLGVPNGQVFQPPYLFSPDGTLADRPVIHTAPSRISYGEEFTVSVSEGFDIRDVVLLRTDIITHSSTPGIRYVRLTADALPDGALLVRAPTLPASAVMGQYMLFAVDTNGVPSVASYVNLTRASSGDFRRGDARDDGGVSISDAITMLEALFQGGSVASCRDAADANDDGRFNVSDPVSTLLALFRGREIPDPGASLCGPDPTDDTLDCQSSTACP